MRKAFKPFAFLAAIAPAFLPREAAAEVVISSSTAGPVLTSTGADDLRVSSAGSINIAAPGVAVTVNSSDNFTNQGAITVVDSNNSTAVLLLGGNTSDFLNSGSITNLENFAYQDTDNDGDLDTPFADPTSMTRYGVRVSGPGTFVGNITQDGAGIIQVEGRDSAALFVEGDLQGNVDLRGTLSVLGDNSYGFRSTGVIDGDVAIRGTVSAFGENTHGVVIENQVTGNVRIDGFLSANGYRFDSRPSDAAVALLDPEDKLQGGSALWVKGDVLGGVLLNTAPGNADDLDNDEDDDGIPDDQESGTSRLQSFGESPALRIGDLGDSAISLGNIGVDPKYQYGLVNEGTISAVSLLDGFSSTGVRIENATISGGFVNRGSILGGSFDENGIGVSIGNLASVPELINTGSITGVSDSDVGAWSAYGVRVDVGGSVPVLRNSGSIIARRQGEDGIGYAIADYSDSLNLIENTGRIEVVRQLTDDALDTDDADLLAGNEVLAPGARSVAIDLSTQTTASIVRQLAPVTTGASAPVIIGEVWFGSAGDTLDIQAGTLDGDIDFGGALAGNDSMLISGGAVVTGALSNADQLDLDISDGRFNMANLATVNANSLHLGSSGVLELQLNPAGPAYGALQLTGGATFDAGSSLAVVLQSPVVSTTTTTTFTLVDAASVTGGPNVSLSLSPYLMETSTNVTATQVQLDMRRRTAAELGLNANQSAMYENFFTAALGDSEVMESLLGLGTQQTFTSGLNQFLPNATGAQLEFAQTRAQAMTSLLFSRYYGPAQANRDVYAWGHELLYSRDREATTSGQGFEGFGFGFAAGVDGPMGKNGYKGYGLSFTSDEFDEKDGVDRPFTVNSVELMGHAVQPVGRLLLAGRVGVGYDWYKSQRRVEFTPDLNAPALARSTQGDWNGAHVSGNLRAALPMNVGAVRVRPELGLDATSIWEQGYEEKGGGAGVDLAVDAHQSTRASASATVAAGVHVQGGGFIFNPEIMVGARQPLVTEGYETNAEFVSSPGKFTLIGDTVDSTALIAGASMTVDGQIGSLRLEAMGESADGDTSVTGRVVVRLTF